MPELSLGLAIVNQESMHHIPLGYTPQRLVIIPGVTVHGTLCTDGEDREVIGGPTNRSSARAIRGPCLARRFGG